jgi:mannosyltransferase
VTSTTDGRFRRRAIDPHTIFIALIVLAGLGLRLYRLGAQSLWFDEAQTLDVAGYPLAEIARRAYRPPLFHMALHFWMRIAGDSEFLLRLPSTLFGAGIPFLAFIVATRLYDRRAGLLAAALAAISPTLIWYSQELRMYSLMTAQFLALLYLTIRLVRDERSPAWLWGAFFVVQTAAMYTHYFALPFLFWLAILTALLLVGRRRWPLLVRWIAVQAATAVAFIPWLLVIADGRGGTEDYIAAETLPVMTHIPGVREALTQNWMLYTTGIIAGDSGLTGLLSRIELVALGAALLLILVAAAWNLLTRPDEPEAARSRNDLWLLALMAVPAITAVIMFRYRPGVVHARHLMMIAGPFMVLLGRAGSLIFTTPIAMPGRSVAWNIASRLAGLVVLVAFGAGFAVGIDRVLLRPHQDYVRADTRSLAQNVASLTGPDDVVLLPYVDYAFDHYFPGPARVYHVETRVPDEPLLDWLLPYIQGAKRAVLIRWVDAYSDPRDMLPWLLQSNGRLERRFWQAGRWVSVYDLENPIVIPALEPADVRIGPLALRGVGLPHRAVADQPLPIALRWEALEAPGLPYKVSIQVEDPSGHVVAMDDRVILSERDPVDAGRWLPGLVARNYYLPTLPPGSPPIRYTLAVSVYHGDTTLDLLDPHGAPAGKRYRLGDITIEPGREIPSAYAPETTMTPMEHEMAQGLVLEGYHVDRETVQNGGALAVTLYWRAESASLPPYIPEVRLTLDGEIVAGHKGAPAYGEYPCDRWRVGERVIDRRVMRVSPDAAGGVAEIELIVDDERVPLQNVVVEKTDRDFALPAEIDYPMEVSLGGVAILRGVDIGRDTASPNEPLRLTLYWEAISDEPPDIDYVVFTHLLDGERQMVAQHDGAPADGRWPTSTWIKGQIIADTHELGFLEREYAGAATLEVGLYDPTMFQRLTTPSGQDHIVLPPSVTVMP